MNADGSGQTRLTDFYDAVTPAWSPDGQKIAFAANGPDSPKEQIYVMNPDGSGVTRLTSDAVDDSMPAWSPDGQKIAFTRYLPGGSIPSQIDVMNADGSAQTPLTAGTEADWGPAWSPDGRKVAFTCETTAAPEVCASDANGSNQTQLTTSGGAKPAWQPLPGPTMRSATVEQPLEADGSSVFKVGKGVLPVKFALAVDGVSTCELPPATIALDRLSGAVTGPLNESTYTLPADDGSNFRVDDCHYVYNLSLKTLSAGSYRVEIQLDGQTVGSATLELR